MDQGADPLGGLQGRFGAAAQAGGQVAQPVVGTGEPGGPQQAGTVQGRRRDDGWPVVPDALDDGGEPELGGDRHVFGAEQGDDVAASVPAQAPLGRGTVHFQPVRASVLIAMAAGRHDNQPVPQRSHRRVVFVAEALLENVGDVPGAIKVHRAVIKQGCLEHPGVEHYPVPPCLPASAHCFEACCGPPRSIRPIVPARCFTAVNALSRSVYPAVTKQATDDGARVQAVAESRDHEQPTASHRDQRTSGPWAEVYRLRCSCSASSGPSQSRASAARNCCATCIGAERSRYRTRRRSPGSAVTRLGRRAGDLDDPLDAIGEPHDGLRW